MRFLREFGFECLIVSSLFTCNNRLSSYLMIFLISSYFFLREHPKNCKGKLFSFASALFMRKLVSFIVKSFFVPSKLFSFSTECTYLVFGIINRKSNIKVKK